MFLLDERNAAEEQLDSHVIIIIAIYFENITFFHTKLGSNNHPGQGWVTKVYSITSRPVTIRQLSAKGIETSFCGRMLFLDVSQLRIREEDMIFETFSTVVEFSPPYPK